MILVKEINLITSCYTSRQGFLTLDYAVRLELEKERDEKGVRYLWDCLYQIDPRLAESIDENESHAIRSITSSADLISWDSQGRVRISDHLLRHLEIKSKLVLVGVMSRIEVWSLEKFDASIPLLSDKTEKIFFSGY